MKKALDVESDAFGHALLDHLEGRAGHELIERSDGYIDVSAGTDTYFAEPSDEQRLVVEHAVGRILDVGCGAGRYALYLQVHGREVVGIDVLDTVSGGEGIDTLIGITSDIRDETIENIFNPNNPEFEWIDAT